MPLERQESLNIAGGAIGLGVVGILAFVTWALVFRRIPEGNENVLTLLVGILSANVGVIVGFFYGSSVGVKKQTETIDTLARTAQTAGVALGTPESALLIPTGSQATATATPDGTIIEKDLPEA